MIKKNRKKTAENRQKKNNLSEAGPNSEDLEITLKCKMQKKEKRKINKNRFFFCFFFFDICLV